LRHGKQLAADVLQRSVHLAFGIGKYAVAEHAFREPFGLRLRIAAFHADQRKDAAPDGADDTAIHLDARVGNALD